MIEILIILLTCCVNTIMLEALPILFLSNKKIWWKASVVCNLITNPLLNTILMLLYFLIQDLQLLLIVTLALEAVVVCVEGYFYQKMLGKRYLPCFLFSLAANSISFLVGAYVLA